MNKKIIKSLVIIGILGGGLMSLNYTFKLFKSLFTDSSSFIENTSMLVSNITTLVILVYFLRRILNKEKKVRGFLFSKTTLFVLLVYITIVLDILIYGFFKFEKMESYLFIENFISIIFILFCILTTIYMIKNKDITFNREKPAQ